MRVLVTWGSKLGGTEGIARTLGEALREEGYDVEMLPADRAAREAKGFDAAVVGGALYAGRWHRDARRFVERRERDLRAVPVWFFSSGPLGESARQTDIPPVWRVRTLMDSVGAQGHETFGGRLAPDAEGFVARAMAKKMAGDFRDPARIRAWAGDIARALPEARPRRAIAPAGRPISRLVLHAVAGWAACAACMIFFSGSAPGVAIVRHAVAALLVFWWVARRYFGVPGARQPLPTAAVFAAVFALLDRVLVAGVGESDLAAFKDPSGIWLPALLVFAVTSLTGFVKSVMPQPPKDAAAHLGG
jgi:menaquinone-dependent protoporphyrinogen oxidase